MAQQHELSLRELIPASERNLLETSPSNGSRSQRDISVDILRGLVMVLMLFVDVCGDTVPFLAHAEWEGLNVADCVMPGFLFVVGSSIKLSSIRNDSSSSGKTLRSGLLRALRLFTLGVLLQGSWLPATDGTKDSLGFDLGKVRIMGILQRVAICYFSVLALSRLAEGRRTRLAIALMVLALQSVIQSVVCVPGCIDCNDFSIKCNSESYLDRLFLGSNHLYKPEEGYDPEGLVSSLGAIFTCFIGYLMTDLHLSSPLARLLIGGSYLGIGFLLKIVGIPFNKALWTSSYNFVTLGGILMLWSAIRIMASEDGHRNVLVHLGSNAIFFFVTSDCGGLLRVLLNSVWIERAGEKITLVDWFLNSLLRVNEYPYMILVYAFAELCFFACVTSYMYHRGLFLKI